MEMLVASAIGVLTSVGVYVMLLRTSFALILGLSLISYAVNLFLFAAGRLAPGYPPIIGGLTPMTDPLPQALVLTAIVISFGMTAVLVMLALGSYLLGGHDEVDEG